jgi:RNA polymerase sigma factor (sigma-70 family)
MEAVLSHNEALQQTCFSGGTVSGSVGSVERLLVESLPLVDRLSRHFCGRSRMTVDEAEDFASHVRLHLMDGDYAVLRSYEGRCALPTFLALVIQRQLHDYRARHWGRFRSSVAATRLGPVAVRLEMLLLRDGMTIEEAVAALAAEGHAVTAGEAERLARQFPERKPRALEVAVDDVGAQELALGGDLIEQAAAAGERRATQSAVNETMREAMRELPAEDRTILRPHFDAGMSVADIARSLGLEQRPLYRRIGRICGALRERLLAAGVAAADVTEILGRADTDFEFGFREVRNG